MKTIGPIVEHAGSGLKMPEALATRLDELAKELPADFKYTRKASAATVDLGMQDGSRTDVSVVTTDDPDREGDVVLPLGLNLDEFRRSPDVFFAHDYAQLPVGKALWIKQKDNSITAMTQYARRPANWQGEWLPDAIHSLIQEGMCRGKSVGFAPLSKRVPTSDELSRRPDWKGKRVVDRGIVFEYSVAPIPMNPHAMAVAVSKCVKDETLRKAVCEAARAMGTEIDMTGVLDEIEAEATAASDAPPPEAAPVTEPPPPEKTPEELAVAEKAAKRAAALEIIVPILRPEAIREYQQALIERQVQDCVTQVIQDAYARRKGRA